MLLKKIVFLFDKDLLINPYVDIKNVQALVSTKHLDIIYLFVQNEGRNSTYIYMLKLKFSSN